MKKLYLLSLLFLFSFMSPLSYTESYLITDSQLEALEKNSKNRENLLQKQSELLMKQTSELKTQEQQLNDSKNLQEELKIQIENLDSQLKMTSESLKKSENKNLKDKLIIGGICLVLGAGLGAFLAR